MSARRAVIMLLALGIAGPLWSQERPGKTEAALRYEKFEAGVTKHRRAFQKAQMERYEQWRASGKDGLPPAFRMSPPIADWIAEFMWAAEDYSGTEECVRYHLWIVRNAGSTSSHVVKRSLATLMKEHVESPQLLGLASTLPHLRRTVGRESVDHYMGALMEATPHDEVKAQLLVSDAASRSRKLSAGTPEWQAVKAGLERAISLSQNKALVDRARGMITRKERLVLGAIAPEIEGKDTSGVAFKLSDYRGKVVLLDFWGDW